jgi:hypothetical protein
MDREKREQMETMSAPTLHLLKNLNS